MKPLKKLSYFALLLLSIFLFTCQTEDGINNSNTASNTNTTTENISTSTYRTVTAAEVPDVANVFNQAVKTLNSNSNYYLPKNTSSVNDKVFVDPNILELTKLNEEKSYASLIHLEETDDYTYHNITTTKRGDGSLSAPVIRKYKTTLPKNEITSTNYKETSWEISQQIIDDSARTDRDLLDCPKGLIIPINGGGIFANYISGYDFSDSFGNTNNTRPHGPSTGSQKGWTTICSSSVKVVSYSCNGPNSGIDHPEGPNSGDSGDPGCGDRSTNYGGSGHKIVNEIRCVTIVTEHQAVGPSTGVSLQDLGEEVHFTITEDNTPCELQEVRDGFIANRDNLNPIQQLLLNRLIEVLGEDNDEYCSPDYNGTLNLGNDIFSSSLDKTSNRSGLPNEVECPPFMDDITIATPTEVFRLLVLISRFSINGQLSEAGKAWVSDYGNINKVRKILQFVETNNNSAEAIEFAQYAIGLLIVNPDANPFLGADCRSFEFAQPPGALQKGCAVSDFNHRFYTFGVRPNGSPYYGEIDINLDIIYFTMPTWMTNGQAANTTAVAVTDAIKVTDIYFFENPDVTQQTLADIFRDTIIAQLAIVGGTVNTSVEPFPIPSPAPYITSVLGLSNPFDCN